MSIIGMSYRSYLGKVAARERGERAGTEVSRRRQRRYHDCSGDCGWG